MAWNLKYYAQWFEFDTSFGTSCNRLEFYVQDSGISPMEVTLRSLKLKQPKIDLFSNEDALIGTGLDIGLISHHPLDFKDFFYTINPLGIKVMYYTNYMLNKENTNPPFFVGYVDPEQYYDPISKRLNYEINITANNGFSALERIPFLDNSGNKLVGLWSLIDIIHFCLKKLDIDYSYLNLGLYTKIYNPNIGKTSTSRLYHNYYDEPDFVSNGEGFLHELYLNVDNFYDEDDNEMNCRQVLNSILIPITAKMYAHVNQIFILDIFNISKDPVNAVYYTFSDLTYQGSKSGNFTSFSRYIPLRIIQAIKDHSVNIIPGKRKIDVSFNKYVQQNPIPIEISTNTMSGFKGQTNYEKDDDVDYKEFAYSNCQNIIKLENPNNVEFIQKLKPNNDGDDTETFIRFYPTTESYWAVQINTGIYVHSSKSQFFGLSGKVMADKISDYANESSISAMQNHFPLIVRFGVQQSKTGVDTTMTNDMFHNRNLSRTYWKRSKVSDPQDESTDTPVIYLKEYDGAFKYNKWYELNGGSYVRTYWTGSYKNFQAPIFPLKNWGQNDTASIDGGYLFIQIFVPKEGDTKLEDTNNEWWGYGFLGMSIKDLKIHILESTEKEGNLLTLEQYKRTENHDAQYQVTSNYNYKEELSISTEVGTDLKTMCRGALYFFKKYRGVDDVYYDCMSSIMNYQHEIKHDRFVRVKYFNRGLNEGYLENLLLYTYMSNLQQNRYSLSINIKGMWDPFQKFTVPLLKKDGTEIKLIIVGIEYDCVESITYLQLEEIIQEKPNQLSIPDSV